MLKINGHLDIGAAGELRQALKEVLALEEPRIDLSEVHACDTASLQLICSAGKSAAGAAKPLRFTCVSDAVLETSALLGLPLEAASGSPAINAAGVRGGVPDAL